MTDTNPNRLIVEYQFGQSKRRDVYEDGRKRVEELDYISGGEEKWEVVVEYEAKNPIVDSHYNGGTNIRCGNHD